MIVLKWLLLLIACGGATILMGWMVAVWLLPRADRAERDWKSKNDR